MAARQVKVVQGILEGEEFLSYAVFKGVPYAKPPVGALRFRAPQPLEPWEGVRQAKTFAARSIQELRPRGFYRKEFYSDPDFLPPVSEDCLNLNIWTPVKKSPDAAGYPVAFWIHGGGFGKGAGSEVEFDGAEYARRGVILVTINYRLGLLGFLAHPLLREEDPHGSCGNYGILDQIAALSWVRDNIAAFGGDPDNITIFGQSAGAMSVQTLANSPLSKGMFARAIMQSAGGYQTELTTRMTMDQAMQRGKYLMQNLKISTLEELRRVDAHEFEKQVFRIMMKVRGPAYSPVLDGYVLTDELDNNLKAGREADVPYMLGSTSEEYMVPKGTTGRESGSIYRGCKDWALIREEHSEKPTYVYYFKRQLPGDKSGAFHSAELWYMFGTLHRCWRPMTAWDDEISHWMLNAWTNFMKYGDPNGAPGSYDPADAWRPCRKDDPCIHDIG